MAINGKKGKGTIYGSSTYLKNYKINRLDPLEHEDLTHLPASGLKTEKRNDIDDIMKHNYLRKSMEQRIQRKALMESFKKQKLRIQKTAGQKDTLSSKLRSLSIK